jgi:hypothetical protein
LVLSSTFRVTQREDAVLEAFCGIDVACAKRKRLPVNVSVRREGKLVPLELRGSRLPQPPRGAGNVKALDEKWLESFASETVDYLRELEKELSICIERIAIDAPSSPRIDSIPRRRAEVALDARGISCFATPSAIDFETIKSKVRKHLDKGGSEAELPHANQLWMLVGFELFRRLKLDWDCLEVYPQATAAVLQADSIHKSKPDGLTAQLQATRKHTGWPNSENGDSEILRPTGYGQLHDCLDTYLAAWVASLSEEHREALGQAPDDAIWVPRLNVAL